MSDIKQRIQEALGNVNPSTERKLTYEETLRRRGSDDPQGFSRDYEL